MTGETSGQPATRRRSIEQAVIVRLAGAAGERQAYLLSGVKNRQILPWPRRVAVHEAAHAVAALVFGEYVHLISTIPRAADPAAGVTYYSGVCKATKEKNPVDPLKISDQIVGDVKWAALSCWLLGGGVTWRSGLAVYRRLKAETERLIEAHWQEITTLAAALIARKSLVQAEINQVLSVCE